MNKVKAVLLEKKYVVPFILITCLFSLWGFANDITNPMVAAFQTVMEISTAKAAMVQLAFYGGYGTMAIPAALFAMKYSYKKGILLGLLLYAVGALLFFPAAQYEYVWILPGFSLHLNLRAGISRDHCQPLHPVNGR